MFKAAQIHALKYATTSCKIYVKMEEKCTGWWLQLHAGKGYIKKGNSAARTWDMQINIQRWQKVVFEVKTICCDIYHGYQHCGNHAKFA